MYLNTNSIVDIPELYTTLKEMRPISILKGN